MAENAESKDEEFDDMVIGGNADFKPGQKYPTPAPANVISHLHLSCV